MNNKNFEEWPAVVVGESQCGKWVTVCKGKVPRPITDAFRRGSVTMSDFIGRLKKNPESALVWLKDVTGFAMSPLSPGDIKRMQRHPGWMPEGGILLQFPRELVWEKDSNKQRPGWGKRTYWRARARLRGLMG